MKALASFGRRLARIGIAAVVCTLAVSVGVANATTVRINAGSGSSYTDTQGNTWRADVDFNVGKTIAWTGAIGGTASDALYRTERYDPSASPELQYGIPVPNGTYTVRLHFAENYDEAFAVGARVFDVDIEGRRAFDNIDIYAAVGPKTALIRQTTATVADGSLDILFRHQVENPLINAIEVLLVDSGGTGNDTTPPSAATNLQATTISTTNIGIRWSAATDPAPSTGIARYEIAINGRAVASSTTTSYTASGLSASTTYSFTVVAIDGAGNRSVASSPLAVRTAASSSNSAPSISGSPPTSVLAGQTYSFTPSASDPNGDALTFSVQNKPAWASFSSATGRLSGTPSSAYLGTYSSIVIKVSDGTTTSSLPAFSVAVLATASGAATVSWTPPTQNVDGSTLTNLAGYLITYGTSAGSLSQSIKLMNPGITSAMIENLTAGTWYFAVKAITASGAESDLSTVVSKTVR